MTANIKITSKLSLGEFDLGAAKAEVEICGRTFAVEQKKRGFGYATAICDKQTQKGIMIGSYDNAEYQHDIHDVDIMRVIRVIISNPWDFSSEFDRLAAVKDCCGWYPLSPIGTWED